MSRITAATPSDFATTVLGPRLHNVFYPGEALAFTLSIAGATGYTVRDYTGTVVSTGSVSGTTLTLPSAPFTGKYGWWRMQLSGPDAGDGAFGTDKGACSFCIFPSDANYPTAPLRSSNPTNTSQGQTDGILHGVIGAGMLRRTFDVKDAYIRQGSTAHVASGTSITTTNSQYTGGNSTSASMVYAVHVFIGADLTGVGITSTGWTLIGSQNFNSIAVRIYQHHGALSPATITCNSGTVSGEHCLVLEEIQWMNDEAPIIAPVFATGNGTSTSIIADASSLGSQQNYILTAVAASSNTGGQNETGLSPYRGVSDASGNERLLVTEDTLGTGSSHTASYSWTGASDWVSVYFVARSNDNYASNLAATVADLNVMDTWYHAYADGVRDRPKHVQSPAGTIGYESKITLMTNDLASAGHTNVYFEGRNEPQFSYPISEVNAFATGVHAGDATARAVSSGFVSLCDYGSGLNYFASELDAGMATNVDAIGFHDYNMCNGDLRNSIRLYEAVQAVLTSRGITKPMLMTEGGHETTWGGYSGAPALNRIHDNGSAFMKHALVREVVLGVTPEHSFHFYDSRGGYDSVLTWQESTVGIYPGYAMLRTYTSQVRGKTLERRLDFGDGKYHYLGGLWSDPSRTGAKVAVVIADSIGLDNISCYMSGNPVSVTVYDCFGNSSTVTPTNGVYTLTAKDTPQYVEVPAGASFDVRPSRWAYDLAALVPSSGASTTYAASQSLLRKLFDGDLRSSYYYKSPTNPNYGSVYVDTTGTFPSTITTTLPTNTLRADRIMVETPVPWQDTQSLLLDFDVEYQRASDGVWVTAATFTHAATVTVKNWSTAEDTMYDCYTNPQTVWVADLGAEVEISGVRLVVRDSTASMYLDSLMLGTLALSKRITIRSIAVRNVAAASVPTFVS